MAFHRCLKRNRWVFGGNRSGKTECGAVEAVWWARGIHPYRTNRDGAEGWVVSLSYEVQRDVAQAKILRYLDPDWIEEIVMSSGRKEAPSRGIIDYMLIKNVFGGLSKIAFKSCDQGREKFQGASLDFVWFDEEPPLDIYRECKMRVLDKCGEIWGTMTPLKGLTWVYDEIYMNSGGDPEVWHEHIEWSDNPFLDKREIERVSASLDESELAMRRYGRFSVSEGAVYREFDPSRDVVEPFDFPKEWQENVSIDRGFATPSRACFSRSIGTASSMSSASGTRRAERSAITRTRYSTLPTSWIGKGGATADCTRSSTAPQVSARCRAARASQNSFSSTASRSTRGSTRSCGAASQGSSNTSPRGASRSFRAATT